MHHKLPVSKYTAAKRLVYSHLLNSLSIYAEYKEMLCTKGGKFPLYKGRDEKKILYISGVALWLSKSQNQKPLEIASAIASHLLATCSDVFSVQIVPPGWIHLELTHPVLAAWLQNLVVGSGEGERKGMQKSSCLFSVQYAHARCCSLVRLADREGLIKLQEPLLNTSQSTRHVIFPNPIPWLDSEQKLYLNHPAEGRLIGELVQVVDDWESDTFGNAVNWEKAAVDLSQAFETFWRRCRIWGEVEITSPELAQARLGLVIATQFVLRFLLEEKLGVFAPSEL
ncbi:DALR anticodon-binding domain-containing protein [Calothrix sp. PCC 7507]|uniref:DALR anticodon-binding domain-containing protein n=1 Tax=Calothrix sp. PCC 7507 TaxID=99598 RepID=UPI00029EFD2B|nr:DALR anticodon-binding domain-containing protein [Calothrix sp. PCC 7507]AFY32374.1 DALR anticodon binding domain protein [Calothrix sp. PCC 7507]